MHGLWSVEGRGTKKRREEMGPESMGVETWGKKWSNWRRGKVEEFGKNVEYGVEVDVACY